MPFTFSHTCVVLPFLRNKRLSDTALIVGTMSPDLEFFFRMKMKSTYSHTFLGIFLIDFPLALVVMFLFHQLIKVPLINNLPSFFQQRLQELKSADWLFYFKNNFRKIILSFLLGTLTHLFWDSMTHWDGLLVLSFSFFSTPILGIPLFSLAQHFSSVIGLLALGFYIYKLPTTAVGVSKVEASYWFLSIFIGLLIFVIRCFFGFPTTVLVNFFICVLVAGISSFVLSFAIVGFYWLFRKKNYNYSA